MAQKHFLAAKFWLSFRRRLVCFSGTMEKLPENIEVFEQNAAEYDEWFVSNEFVYRAELEAVRQLIPGGRGIEIGVGTGRFAAPLGVKFGVEPAMNMALRVKERGIAVVRAVAEQLPIRNNSFDFALFVVTICFVPEPKRALAEIHRILRPGGEIIVGIVDIGSFLGEVYEKKRRDNKFYRPARFFSTEQVVEMLSAAGFSDFDFRQTVFDFPQNIKSPHPVKVGFGEGGFVAIKGKKEGV